MSCDNGVAESTIHGWLKDEQLCEFIDIVSSADGMKIKNGKAVFTWFVKDRQPSTQISSPVLSIQAQKVNVWD